MLTGNICFVLARLLKKNAIYNSFAKEKKKKEVYKFSFISNLKKIFAVLSFQMFLPFHRVFS